MKTQFKIRMTFLVTTMAMVAIALASQNRQERLNSKLPGDSVLKNMFESSEDAKIFKPRLQPIATKKTTTDLLQCWHDLGQQKEEMANVAGRYISQKLLLEKINSIQYACGNSTSSHQDKLLDIKKKYASIVLEGQTLNSLNICEASTFQFLLRDVSTESQENCAG